MLENFSVTEWKEASRKVLAIILITTNTEKRAMLQMVRNKFQKLCQGAKNTISISGNKKKEKRIDNFENKLKRLSLVYIWTTTKAAKVVGMSN